MPVDNSDPTATQGYVIGSHGSSDTLLRLGRVTNPAGAPGAPSLACVNVPVNNKNDGYSTGVPYPGVPSPTGSGTSWGLDPLGFRPIGGASVRDGKLWTTMTSSVEGPAGTLRLFPLTGDRHSVVFFEINLATNTLVQDGNVFDQSTVREVQPFHTWMGTVAVNGPGHAVVGTSIADDATIAPSAAWAARRADDPLGDFSEPVTYLAGTNTGNARQSFETSARVTRWEDYAQVTVDPCDDMTFYTIAQYQDTPAVATGGNWATGVARILSPPPANAVPTMGTIAATSGQSVTVNGEDFYQTPSTGMPACRTELEITTNVTQVIPTGVTFLSATEIVIDFDATGAPAGAVTVTIANPDGQATTFGLTVGSIDEIFADGFETGDTSQWI